MYPPTADGSTSQRDDNAENGSMPSRYHGDVVMLTVNNGGSRYVTTVFYLFGHLHNRRNYWAIGDFLVSYDSISIMIRVNDKR